MGKLYSTMINTPDGTKEIAAFYGDVTCFGTDIDILTTSAFVGAYAPTPRTVFKALHDCRISVSELAISPYIDLRNRNHIWLSEEIRNNITGIHRIGCIELLNYQMTRLGYHESEQSMINSIRAYFHMLDIAALSGVKMNTIALPLLGSGSQGISPEMLLVPIINECISFLKRNASVKNIYFIEKNPDKAEMIASVMKNSYRFVTSNPEIHNEQTSKPHAFISYSSNDKNIADNLCAKMEQRGIKVWYAPRNVSGPYADSIVKAIDNSAYFIVILSQNSINSQHVLNEIDLAFQNLPNGIKFRPLRIDDTLFTPSFKYYLSRQHWMDASDPPLENRLSEFVQELLSENDMSAT